MGAVRTRERFLSSMNSEMGSHLTPVSTIAFTYPALIGDISCTGVKVDVHVKAQLRSQSQAAQWAEFRCSRVSSTDSDIAPPDSRRGGGAIGLDCIIK